MSENPIDPVPPVSTLPPATPAKPKRRRWKRLLLGSIIVVPLLILLLALLLPTLLSLGPVRSAALSFAGPKIAPNGKVQIDSWSFSWLGGQRISGITLFDDRNAAVAHLNVETGASLLALARGNYDVGKTNVTGDFDVRIDPNGGSNIQHIFGLDPVKPDAQAPKPKKKDDAPPAPTKPVEPIKVPDVKGTVSVKMTGTVSSTDPRDKRIPLTKMEQADLTLDLNDLEKGVGIDGTVRASVDGKPARVAIKGTADVIENHVVVASDLNKLSADLTLTVDPLDLSAANAILAAREIKDTTLAGVLRGKIVINVQPGGTAYVRGEDGLGIDDLVVVAPQLKGDTLALKRIDLPLDVSRDAAALYTIKSTGLKSSLLTIDLGGSVPQQVVQHLIDKQQPGGTGQIIVKTDAPSYAAIAKMLPHVVALPEDVTVTGGGLSNVLTIDLTPDAAKATTALQLSAAGTSKGKAIELKQTTLNASTDLAFPAAYAEPAKAIRGFTIDLAAPFATVKGGGKLNAMSLKGDADLTRFYADAAQFVAMKDTDLKGKLGFNVSTTGDPTNAAETLGAKLVFNATGLTLTQKGKSLLNNDEASGEVDALYKATATQHVITLPQFKVTSTLFAAWTAGPDAWVALPMQRVTGAARTIGGKGEFHVKANDLPRLARIATTQPIDPATELKSGVLDAVLTFGAQEGGSDYAIASKVDVTKLAVGDLLKNESLSLRSDGTLAADTSGVKTTFGIASSFLTLNGNVDARLKDLARDKDASPIPLSTFEMAHAVNATGSANLPKLYALATAISPPAVTTDPKTNQPLPPMRIEGGDLAFKLAVARDDAKHVTRVTLDVPNVDKLQVSRGKNAWSPDDKITLALATDITTDDAKATVTEQIQRLVATLDANVPGVLTAKTTTPIDVTNLSADTPSAKGALTATARLAPLGRLMAAVGGGEPMAIDGNAKVDQTIASSGNGVTLVGGGTITDLNPTGPDAKPLPSQLRTIELKNDLLADLKAKSASIKVLDVVAPQARDVFELNANGTIRELGTDNVFDNVKAKLAYDWAQLWPLVQPIADPTGQSIGKIDPFVGKYEKRFTVSGRYPTFTADGRPILPKEAIRSLIVSGDVQIDRVNLVEKGVDVADLTLPISLKNGIASIAFADGKSPKAFTVNGGRGDLGGLAVNLAGEEPILIDVANKKLLEGATLNPDHEQRARKVLQPNLPERHEGKREGGRHADRKGSPPRPLPSNRKQRQREGGPVAAEP